MTEVKRDSSSGIRLWWLFKDYDLHKVTALSADIAGMDALSLNYWLSKFVMDPRLFMASFVRSSVIWRRKMDPKL